MEAQGQQVQIQAALGNFMLFKNVVISKSSTILRTSVLSARNMTELNPKPYRVFVTRLDMPGNCAELLNTE